MEMSPGGSVLRRGSEVVDRRGDRLKRPEPPNRGPLPSLAPGAG
jgi:hypothetical protein